MTLDSYAGRGKIKKYPAYLPGSPAKKGPPPWAPAHGYRAKYHYRYYPSASIYFDVGRGLYFYFNGIKWLTSPSLPAGIRIELNDFVTLEMDVDKPFKFHSEVIKRYSPGKQKKFYKRKSKGKGKGKR